MYDIIYIMSRRTRRNQNTGQTLALLRETPKALQARERAHAIQERRRRRRIAALIGIPAAAAIVATPFVIDHLQHVKDEHRFEQLDKEHAQERLALAFPYRDPTVERVVETHQVGEGRRTTLDLYLGLTVTPRAAGIMGESERRDRAGLPKTIDWLLPSGVKLYRVGVDAAGKPTIGKPHFMRRFQGRNAGTAINEQPGAGTVAVTLPDLPVGAEEAVYVTTDATSRRFGLTDNAKENNNDVLSETQGQQYVTTLRLVDNHGRREWEVMANPPQLPDLQRVSNLHVPAGPTHNP